MESLTINSIQKQMPTIELDADSGLLTFSGQCYMENADKFFKPVFEWLERYLSTPKLTIIFEMQMDYFNTSSAKCLWEIFIRLERYAKNDEGDVIVRWHFEDDDENTWELFEDFKTEVDLNFEHVNTSW